MYDSPSSVTVESHTYRRMYPQEIVRADVDIKVAADLVAKYRKNVQYNLNATRATEPESAAAPPS